MTSQFLEKFFEKLSVLTNISFTQNGVRHRRMNRGSYYRHFLRWNFDIGSSSRPVVNRDMLNSSGLSQASLLSLAALSGNQFNSQYINWGLPQYINCGLPGISKKQIERAEYATKEKGNIGLDSRPICLTLSNYLG